MWERMVTENCHEVEHGLFRILLPTTWPAIPFTNAWLVCSQGEWAMIDCGMNLESSLYALGRSIKAAGIPRGGLRHLMLTHGHRDHAGAVPAVTQRWGGQIWLHTRDLEFLPATAARTGAWLRRHGVGGDLAARMAAARIPRQADLPSGITPMHDDQVLTVGDLKFAVIPVPGHSPGHVMFWEENRGWLFTGDQVLPKAGWNVTIDPWETVDALGGYLRGLERASALPARLVLPGHGEPMPGSRLTTVCTALARAHRRRESHLAALLGQGECTAYALAERESHPTTTDPIRLLFAVVVALRHLEGSGAVAATERDECVYWRTATHNEEGEA